MTRLHADDPAEARAPGSPDGATLARDEVLRRLAEDERVESGARFLELVAKYFATSRAGDGRVSTAHDPETLAARFGAPPRAGRSLESVAHRLRADVIADSNRLYHPMYMGHQVSAPLPAAVWAEPLISALNQSLAVWEMSPVATVIERSLVRWMCSLAELGADAGGTFTTGGTEATFTALLAARHVAGRTAWEDGVGGDHPVAGPPVIVCGEHAHYSVTRAAGELGIGVRNVVPIPSRGYRMDVSALAERLAALRESGRRVVAVVASSCSTATGSFDDLDAIAVLCDRYAVWLHVDAAHGGSALLSDAHRHRLRGIHRARSIAWDAHKMMLLPLSAGVLLVREERDLDAAFAQDAPYLFGGASGARAWDQGARSFMCSRRADVLKTWVALERYGTDGLAALYETLCGTTRALYDAIAARGDFEALHEPEANILCFRYTPAGSGSHDQVDALNRELREEYNRSGDGWISAAVLDGRPVLRVTVMNPRTRAEHVDRLLAGLAATAKGLSARSAAPTGPEGNDKTRDRPRRDAFDDDLARDSVRRHE